jgi:hypothetical protein
MRRAALKMCSRRYTAPWGRCFKALLRDAFWTWSLADLENPDGFLNLVRVG